MFIRISGCNFLGFVRLLHVQNELSRIWCYNYVNLDDIFGSFEITSRGLEQNRILPETHEVIFLVLVSDCI